MTQTTETKALAKPIDYGAHGVQLRTMEDGFRFAACVLQSGMAPREFDTPQKILIAVQTGAEIGLSPMQSLQSIAVINNRPCLWGDALPALVNASGKCEYVKERIEGEGDARVAVCEAKRRDQAEPYRRTFSVSQAKSAGLWGRKGPWSSYPMRMLQMRARAYAFRDAFADALRGIGVAEEVRDYEQAPRLATDAPPESPDVDVVSEADAPELADPVLDELDDTPAEAETEANVSRETSEPTPEEIAEIHDQEAKEAGLYDGADDDTIPY